MVSQKNAKDVVLACVAALNEENFDLARQFVSDDVSFDGVLGSRRGAESYFKDMERMRLKYDIRKVFVDGQDVCLFYNLTMSGSTLLVSAWYHVEGGKIQSLQVVFDPRPVLAAKAA